WAPADDSAQLAIARVFRKRGRNLVGAETSQTHEREAQFSVRFLGAPGDGEWSTDHGTRSLSKESATRIIIFPWAARVHATKHSEPIDGSNREFIKVSRA